MQVDTSNLNRDLFVQLFEAADRRVELMVKNSSLGSEFSFDGSAVSHPPTACGSGIAVGNRACSRHGCGGRRRMRRERGVE